MAISPETLTWEKNDMSKDKYFIEYKRGKRTITFIAQNEQQMIEEYAALKIQPTVKIIQAGSCDGMADYVDGKWFAYDPYSLSHWE
jgi:hypothetical protein